MTKKYYNLDSIYTDMAKCWVIRTEFRGFKYFY